MHLTHQSGEVKMQLSPETNEILPALFNARNKFAKAKKDAKTIT